MLHGRDRATVLQRLAEIVAVHDLARFPSAVLFSRRAFKQRGARYAQGPRGAEAEWPRAIGDRAHQTVAFANAAAPDNAECVAAAGD